MAIVSFWIFIVHCKLLGFELCWPKILVEPLMPTLQRHNITWKEFSLMICLKRDNTRFQWTLNSTAGIFLQDGHVESQRPETLREDSDMKTDSEFWWWNLEAKYSKSLNKQQKQREPDKRELSQSLQKETVMINLDVGWLAYRAGGKVGFKSCILIKYVTAALETNM